MSILGIIISRGDVMSNMLTSNSELNDIKLKGTVRIVERDANHNIVNERVEHNNILLQIRQPIVKLLGGLMTDPSTLPFVSQIGFGEDDTPPTILDTGLIAPVSNSRRLIATAPTFSNDGLQVTFAVLYDLIEPDIDGIAIKEACLYTRDNVAIARTVIGSYTKVPGLFFEYYWTIGYQP
jgi:hypothetical protein